MTIMDYRNKISNERTHVVLNVINFLNLLWEAKYELLHNNVHSTKQPFFVLL